MARRANLNSLTIYRRHAGGCKATYGCNCTFWMHGRLGGKFVRKSLNTRSEDAAKAMVKAYLSGDPPPSPDGLHVVGRNLESRDVPPEGDRTLSWAVAKFVEFTSDKNRSTRRSYQREARRFLSFAEAQGVTLLPRVDADLIRAYRRQRLAKLAVRTQICRLDYLRVFFGHALNEDWIVKSPFKKGIMPKTPTEKTRKPFSPREVTAILAAIEKLPPGERARARALILLMLYTGMRISDASFIERDYLSPDGTVNYAVIKTGRWIDEPPPALPPQTMQALQALPPSRVYFFVPDRPDDYRPARKSLHEGAGNFCELLPGALFDSTIHRHTKLVKRVLRRAGVYADPVPGASRQGVCHRFRDTFAVTLLLNGVNIVTVSKMLGHANINLTVKKYVKFTKEHREAMGAKTDLFQYHFPLIPAAG